MSNLKTIVQKIKNRMTVSDVIQKTAYITRKTTEIKQKSEEIMREAEEILRKLEEIEEILTLASNQAVELEPILKDIQETKNNN